MKPFPGRIPQKHEAPCHPDVIFRDSFAKQEKAHEDGLFEASFLASSSAMKTFVNPIYNWKPVLGDKITWI